MSTLAVIARYKEDINWVKMLYIPYLIINKGDPIIDPIIQPHVIEMENSVNGREGHTFLSYIIEHYECLPDKLIFLQGNPFDHQPKILILLGPRFVADMPDFLPLTLYYSRSIPPFYIRNQYSYKYNNIDIYIGTFGDDLYNVNQEWSDSGFIYWLLPNIVTYIETLYPNTDISLREKIYKFFELPYNKNIPTKYFYGAMFHVKKELILKKPKEYYIRLKELLEKNIIVGYILERMWLAIFTSI